METYHIGFTGTRAMRYVKSERMQALEQHMANIDRAGRYDTKEPPVLHHGDCVGADEYHFFLNERMAFIASKKLILTSDITRIIGVRGNKKDTSPSGIVVELTHYDGMMPSSLWEWLSKIRKYNDR